MPGLAHGWPSYYAMPEQYFYLVSTLPLLTLEEKPPLLREQFLEGCAGLLKQADYRVLASTRLTPHPFDPSSSWDAEPPHELQQRWYNFEVGLRNLLVQLRAADLEWNTLLYLRLNVELDSLIIIEAVREAFDLEMPLKLELRLIELRWLFLDELTAGHRFDLTYLILYCLRLELLERWAQIETLLGAERFKTTYRTLHERNREHLTI